MGIFRRLLKNAVIILSANIVLQILAFISSVYLARVIGPAGFGKINFAMAIVSYFGMIASFGIPMFAVKEAARTRDDPGALKEKIGNIVALRIILTVSVVLSLFLFTVILPKPLDIKMLIVIYGIGLLFPMFSIDWAFQAIERMEYMMLPVLIGNLSYTILIISLIKNKQQLLTIPILSLIAGIIAATISIFIFIKNFGKIKLNFSLAKFKNIIRQALPIGVVAVSVQAIYQLPAVMLGFMRTDQELGLYNAAFKLVFSLLALINIFNTIIFPTVSYYYSHSLELFKRIINSMVRLMFFIALPLSFGVAVLAKSLMLLTYGMNFIGGTIVLQLLIWDVVVVYVGCTFGLALIASHKQKELSYITLLMAVICIVSNLVMIPLWGIAGSAISILITELVGVSLQYIALNRLVRIPIHSFIIKPLFSAIVMSLVVLLASCHSRLGAPALIVMGACVYFISFCLLRGITKDDIMILRRALFFKGLAN